MEKPYFSILTVGNTEFVPLSEAIAYAEKCERTGKSEGRKQGLMEAVSIMKRHPEGEGEWCDTGEDMEWACRSECVERAVKRIRAAIEKEGK